MNPTTIEGSNLTLKKPEGMTDEQCVPIEAIYNDTGEFPFFTTAWQPTEEDVKAINEGKPVFLQVVGYSHPPVAIYTLNDKNEINE